MANTTAPARPIFRPRDLHQQAQDLFDTGLAWLKNHLFEIMVAVAVGALIAIALHAARGIVTRLCQRDPGNTGWGHVFERAAVRTNNFFIVMLAARLVTGNGFTDPPAEVVQVVDFLWTVASVFQAAIWVREIILGAIEHRTASEHYAGEALINALGLIRLLVTFGLFAIAAVVVLENLGVNVTGLVAGLGVGGIAIGLAAQGIFADLFAALAIIFDRPFRRGDAISYDQSSGTVESIGLKSTRIRAPTGEERIISNKHLLDKEILNNTKRDYRRVSFTLGVVQWTPVEVMERLPHFIKEVVEGCGRTFVRAGFTAFNASSYDFSVEFDVTGGAYQDYYDARHSVGLAIIRRFAQEGIELAYPTQTSFTAAPEGGLIYPYPVAAHPERQRDAPGLAAPPAPPPSSGDTSAMDQD